MYPRIQHWLQKTFPRAKIELDLGGAIPATTATYLSYCMNEHIPQDADLVLVELDINANPLSEESIASTEAVMRSALALPNQPAVVYLSIFALSFDNMVHGWLASLPSAAFLDVPHINIRNFMLPHLMQHPDEIPHVFKNWASEIELRHINNNAHVAMAESVTLPHFRKTADVVQHGLGVLPRANMHPGPLRGPRQHTAQRSLAF
jgi:hypothetical protein